MNEFFITTTTSLGLIALAEMGDKTQLVCMTLAARHRALPVWLGAVAAFVVLNLLAVVFGATAARHRGKTGRRRPFRWRDDRHDVSGAGRHIHPCQGSAQRPADEQQARLGRRPGGQDHRVIPSIRPTSTAPP